MHLLFFNILYIEIYKKRKNQNAVKLLL